jgi:hypothetical protein
LGVADPGTEGLADSYSKFNADSVVLVGADATSYSLGVVDPDTETFADSYSELTAAVDVVYALAGSTSSRSAAAVSANSDVPGSVSATTDSQSTVGATTAVTIFVGADGESYSFGIVDPDTETLADSYSELTTAVDVIYALAGSTDSRSNAGVTPVITYFARADADSYSLGVVDPDTETFADSYSELAATVAAAVNIEFDTFGSADSRSTAAVTVSSNVPGAASATADSRSALTTATEVTIFARGDGDSYSFGIVDPDTETLADSYSELAFTGLNVALDTSGLSDSRSAAAVIVSSNVPGAASATAESLSTVAATTSFSVFGGVSVTAASRSTLGAPTTEVTIFARGDGESYSFGIVDPDTETLADSYSELTFGLDVAFGAAGSTDSRSAAAVITSLNVPNAASVTAASRSTLGVPTTEVTIFARGDGDSYSFGIVDPDTETLADSYSELTFGLDVAFGAAGTTDSRSAAAVSAASTSDVPGGASATAASRSALTTATEVTIFARGDGDSYSFGIVDPDTETLADSYSELAVATNVALDTSGSSDSRSTPAVTVSSNVPGAASATAESRSTVTATTSFNVSGGASVTAASRSTLGAPTTEVTLFARGDGESYSFGIVDPDTETLADSYSELAVATNVALDTSGSTDSRSAAAVAASLNVPGAASVTAASRSTLGAPTTEVTLFARGDGDSYSFGIVDPDTETLADSYSELAVAVNVAFGAAGTTDSRSAAAVTNTNVVVATRTETSDSRSVAMVASLVNANAVVATRTEISDSRSTAAVTNTSVVVATRTGTSDSTSVTEVGISVATTRAATSDSRSTATVMNTNVVVATRTGTSDSASAVSATTTFIPTMMLSAAAASLDRVAAQQRFWQRQQITATTSANYEIPAWVEWVDELAVGGGAGSTGSVLLAAGKGGRGGTWAVRENSVNTVLAAAGITTEPTRMYATVNAGAGGAGGPYNGATIQAGQPGGASRVQVFAVAGGVTKAVNTVLTAAGGTAAAGGGLADSNARPGGPAQGGNATAGRDYRILPDPGFTYVGGAGNGTTTTGFPGNPPGGGAGGNGAGNNINGNRGADGAVWLRLDSQSYGVTAQQQFVTPGSGEFDLPLTTSLVMPAVVGAGAGGYGGSLPLNGNGGQGGRWATAVAAWNVESLLPAGVSLSSLTRLWVEWTVGRGGAGGDATNFGTNPGAAGTASTATLKCRTATTTYTIGATRTGVGGLSIAGSGSAGEQNGLQVLGGNINSSRDMLVTVNGQSFVFTGGAALPTFGAITLLNRPLRDGNAPGGGGDGGTAGGLGGTILAGKSGANGAVHVVYVYRPITKDTGEEADDMENGNA